MKVALLSGGVGGARFARGLQAVLAPGELTVIGNVGDDVEVLGLHVSPDLDSVLYALAELHDEERGWGRAGETWNALESAAAWGGERWFRLGDLDIGLHLVRTQALRAGEPLSAVTARLARPPVSRRRLVPATDDGLRTHVVTPAGTFGFQEWFVGRGHRDEVDDVLFDGADAAAPAPGVARGARGSRRDLIAPEQPVRLDPPDPRRRRDPRRARLRAPVRCVAVSPLIGGRAVKGPARPYALAHGRRNHARATSPSDTQGLIDALVIDESDAPAEAGVRDRRHLDADDGSRARARRLAEVALEAAGVKVAVVGGTGSLRHGVAVRLTAAGYEVVIGSRDAARARAAAAAVGVEGATNTDAVRAADLVILATKADGALETARELRDAIGATPVLSVAAELRFTPQGVLPTAEATSIARAHPGRARRRPSSPVCTRSRRRISAVRTRPTRTRSSAATTPDAKALALEIAGRITDGRAVDAGPLASARALEGMTAVIVNVNKRYKAHAGLRVTGLP